MSVATSAAAVPNAVLSPGKTARTHPYVVIAVFVALTILAVVAIEARKPGTFARLVGRLPFVGPRILRAA
jgi:hypothetical protein